MSDKELMQQALDALEHCAPSQSLKTPYFVIEALRARLAQPEPLPKKSKGALSHKENERHNKIIMDKVNDINARLYAQPEPEPITDKCRIELVTALHSIASDYENSLGALGKDAEARRKAEGDIAYARQTTSRWNWNGTQAQPEPEQTRSQKLRDAGITRRSKGWDKDGDEPEPVANPDGCSACGIKGIHACVGYRWKDGDVPPSVKYTAPPQREWQGLTDEEVKSTWSELWYDLNNGKLAASDDPSRHTTVMFARAIEAKLKEKNT